MGSWEISLIGFGAMLFLMGLGIPISFAMLTVGALGIAQIVGLKAALGMPRSTPGLGDHELRIERRSHVRSHGYLC